MPSRQQQRAPVPAATQALIAANVSHSCLHDAHVYFVGVSEILNVVDALAQSLHCKHVRGIVPMDRWQVCEDRRLRAKHIDYRDLAECREDLYSRYPFVTRCSALGPASRLVFSWKSHMFTRARDERLRARVLASAAAQHEPSSSSAPRQVLLVLSGGPAHFAFLRGYQRGLSTAIPDHFEIPQAWVDDYLNATLQLFDLLAPARLPPNVCVVWKGLHIARRHNGSAPHHPSTLNGPHHWLNRFTAALARRHHIGVVDTSDVTLAVKPRGFRAADVRGRGGSEGDPYHGYPDELIVPQVVQRTCTAATVACAERARSRSIRR